MNSSADTNDGAKTMTRYNNAGSKFDPTLDIKDIAKELRKDIKKLVKAGFFTGMKVSVRISRYSMGQSLNVTIIKWDGDIMNADFVQANDEDRTKLNRYVPRAAKALAVLKAFAGSRNYDNSDSMTDYYDVNYATSVTFDTEIFEADWAAKKTA